MIASCSISKGKLINSLYLSGRSLVRLCNKSQHLKPRHFVAFALEEFVPVEEAVHGEVDVRVAHLSPALGYDEVGVEGVMHHHQDCWFTNCQCRDDMRRMSQKRGETRKARY